MLRALVLVLALLGARSAAADPCDGQAMRDALRARGLPVKHVTSDGAGGVFLFLGHAARVEALAWAARLPGGQIASSHQAVADAGGSTRPWEAVLGDVYRALAAPALAGCPQLAAPPGGRPDVGARLDALRTAVGLPAGPPPATAAWSSPRVVTWLALLEVLALAALLAVRAGQAVRARPREALGLAALVAGAVLVRALATSRHPIGAANGDFTHVLHAATWLADGFGADFGAAYPPAYRVLLAAVYAVTGPSLQVGFWLTTLLGALTAVPVALLARRLAGPMAALYAGLALATYPAAVFFSNGVDLSMPAAFLLALSFERLLAAVDRPTPPVVATWALALLLFVQCRLEAVGLALPIAAAQLVMVLEARSPGVLRRLAPAAAASLALALPYAGFLLAHAADLGKADDALRLLAAGCAALALATVLAFLAGRLIARRPGAALAAPVVLGVATLALLAAVVSRYSGNAFLPVPQVVPEFPFVRYHVEQGPLRYVDPAGLRFFLTEPGLFPLALLVPWALSLLPTFGRGQRRLPLAPLLLLGLPLVAWLATSRSHTGVVLAEGLRLHAAFAGLVAASIGIGAARVLAWVGPGPARWVAGALLAVAALAPLVTHRDLAADGERAPQAEARFVEAALERLADGTTVLLPDDVVDLREEHLGLRHVNEVFRTDHLWQALVAIRGKAVTVVPLSTFLTLPLPAEGPIVAALGLDCARAPHPETRSPSCRRLGRALKGAPLQAVQLPNLTYETLGLASFQPSTATLSLSVLPVDPSEVTALRRDAASRLVKGAPGQVY